jgi:hypothetical protein
LCHPEHRLAEQAVVRRGTPAVGWLAQQHVRNTLPLVITQNSSSHQFSTPFR